MNDTCNVTEQAVGHLAALIPVWQPEDRFPEFVAELIDQGFAAIVIVNDGSGTDRSAVFDRVVLLPGVHVLKHALNLGKGRALKTGINYFLSELPGLDGLVTADADGQHTVKDIVCVAHALYAAGGTVVLGSRSFSADVPLRSRIGNGLTRYIFGFVTGTRLMDTQTGLRAFPRSVLGELLLLTGERYEYEMTVLAHICRSQKPIEVPIETVYIDGNRSSHFDPVRDSMRIYFVLARFYFSSIVAAGIDFAGFSATFALTHNLLLSVAVGRLSSLVNFALNKTFVFRSKATVKGTLWRYFALVAAIGTISYGMTYALQHYLRWNVYGVKPVVDTLLSLVSFSVQRTFVFRKVEE